MKHKDTFKRTSLVWLYFALVAVLILVIVTLIMSAVCSFYFAVEIFRPVPQECFPSIL